MKYTKIKNLYLTKITIFTNANKPDDVKELNLSKLSNSLV